MTLRVLFVRRPSFAQRYGLCPATGTNGAVGVWVSPVALNVLLETCSTRPHTFLRDCACALSAFLRMLFSQEKITKKRRVAAQAAQAVPCLLTNRNKWATPHAVTCIALPQRRSRFVPALLLRCCSCFDAAFSQCSHPDCPEEPRKNNRKRHSLPRRSFTVLSALANNTAFHIKCLS